MECRSDKEGYCGYSQQTVDALTAERDKLIAENARLREENEQLKSDNKQLAAWGERGWSCIEKAEQALKG